MKEEIGNKTFSFFIHNMYKAAEGATKRASSIRIGSDKTSPKSILGAISLANSRMSKKIISPK